MKSLTLFLVLFTFSPFSYSHSDSDNNEKALSEAQKLLRSPSERQEVISKDKKAQQADQIASEAVGHDPALKNEMYDLSADVLKHVMKSSNSDPAKAQELLMNAMKDPKKFMNSLPAADQEKIRDIANSVEKNKNPKP